MSVSRRKFIKVGIMTTVCAQLFSPLKSVLAQTGTATQTMSSPGSIEQLNYYTKATFAPYLNTRFRVYLGPTNTRSLNLTEVGDYLASMSQKTDVVITPGEECFSLLFKLPQGKPFVQDTYLIKHDSLGTFYMFVVPVGTHSKTGMDFYEAVIFRLQPYSGAQVASDVSETQPTATTVQAQPGQTQPRVSAGGMLILPGGQSASEESDIYRFRPVKPDSAAIAEKAKAPKRKIYRLSLGQSPVINGLRLGMTPEQILALFPGSKTDEEVLSDLNRPPTRFGVSTFKLRPEKYSSSPRFKGISQFIFTLLDGHVSTLYVGYDGPVWGHVDEFVTEFSEGRNLPAAEDWEPFIGMDTQLKTLNCKEFEISLFANSYAASINYVQVRDLLALRKFNERRAKALKEEMNGAKQ